jgi:hypothetical protein
VGIITSISSSLSLVPLSSFEAVLSRASSASNSALPVGLPYFSIAYSPKLLEEVPFEGHKNVAGKACILL